jgi:EAL domain-containing protein (putative c-di-GMP-specific phosphodiesterase class I)
MQLIEAVEQGTIDLHYQPLVHAQTGRFMGFEALARWKTPQGVSVEPSQFMTMADRYGQAFPLGEQLLRKACSTCCDFVGVDPDFVLHVNVSPVQLLHPLFEVCVNDALRLSGMPAKNLCLEITEAAVADPRLIGPKIERIRARGVRFALDDFGMGYSSLSHIRRLAVDAIKIDRFFVSGRGDDIADPPIVRTVTTLAKELGLVVVAEGVETAQQAQFLRELGCDVLQGFLFGRPEPSDRARQFTFASGQQALHA